MIEVNIDFSPIEKRLRNYDYYFHRGGLQETLGKIGDYEYNEHLLRFDYYQTDYLGNPLMGYTEQYHNWKVAYTGLTNPLKGILTGKMRSQLFFRVDKNSLFLENFVTNDRGEPYAQYFQKYRKIFGFSSWEKEHSRQLIIKDMEKL